MADPPLVIVGDAEVNGSTVVNPSETAEIDATVPVAKILSGFVTCSQNVTVNTNAADATGGQSIALVAGKSLAWNNQSGAANPFTPNITKFYVINATVKAATFRFGFLLQTP
jgi:hypothetical protein